MRYQGLNSNGEELSSAYVEHDPKDYGTASGGPSLARQEFADECDINNLMARYEATGSFSHFNRGEPQYLDVSAVPNLAEAMDVVEQARRAFMTLPAAARREFDNDPVRFVDYASNGSPEALERLRGWGLAPPAPEAPTPPAASAEPPKA